MTTEKQIHQPLIWPSIARLIATGAIFVFHFQGLFGYNKYRLDFYAILMFCFLSGYLAKIDKEARSKWFITRYFGIMVPYWLVIIPVILVNELIKYKHISYFDYAVTIAGGNMFLENPIYVIAWYITFVLILYVYVFVESFFHSYSLISYIAISTLVFTFLLGKGYYFVAFVIGLRLSEWLPQAILVKSIPFKHYLSSWTFVGQKYCYPFFLIHGASLLFFMKIVNFSPIPVFVNSFFLSIVLSIMIYNIGKPISLIAANKTLTSFSTLSSRLWRLNKGILRHRNDRK